ncbi:phosphatidylcholine translocator ABCB4-like [Gigantopelta aegis]|uniref:phosphatidylcholine translocator ABCB4-like n=1 Tax=Gigantopelta aegis TaxID=1735272 RepID=UPI001B88DCF0|nr:phosphatidylcholine translocator ABCB4-like [Gigantopelta aegis]
MKSDGDKSEGCRGTTNPAFLCDGEDKWTNQASRTPHNNDKQEHTDKRPVNKAIGFTGLFRYANLWDVFLCLTGTLSSVVSAVAVAINLVIYGNVIDVFVSAANNNSSHLNGSNSNNIENETTPYAYIFTILGIVSMVTGYVSVTFWTWTAERQIKNMRTDYFRAVVTQEMTWFDTQNPRELSSRLSHDIPMVAEAIGGQMAMFIQWLSTWLTCNMVSLYLDWRLALVTMSFCPVLVFISVVLSRWVKLFAGKESRAVAEAESVTTESLRAIRTVQAFQGQEKEAARYTASLGKVKHVACKKGFALGLSMSAFWFIIFAAFAVTFWYGMHLVQQDDLKPGKIVPIFIGLIIANVSLSYAFPFFGTLANARGAAARVFSISRSSPLIDSASTAGQVVDDINGSIQFKNVGFSYPSRPQVKVLKGLDLHIPAGKKVALVGPSGCGKSTVLQLILRMYDPSEGEIHVNGIHMKELNVQSVRRQMGVVGQEPVLFGCTVEDNIRCGCARAAHADIVQSAREANAHDFISQLPQGYDTMLGEGGAQLSGGQKQRIAIARALVRNPTLLLLDEATSALDDDSELAVRKALDVASRGRTTVVVAHRLSTVEDADLIIALREGRVVEQGTHQELMEGGELYPQLDHIIRTTDEDISNVVIVEYTDDSDVEDETRVLSRADVHRLSRGSSVKLTICKRRTQSVHNPEVALSSRKSASLKQEYQQNRNKVPSVDTSDTLSGQVDCTRNLASGVCSESAEKQADDKMSTWQGDGLIRVLKMNRPQWISIVIGCFSSIVAGCIQPAFAFFLTDFIRAFGMNQDPEEQARLSLTLCILITVGGVVTAVLKLAQTVSFVRSSTALTNNIRQRTFYSLLHQNATVTLQVSGVQIGNLLETGATLVFSLAMAFSYGWKLTLVVLSFLPLMIGTGIIKGKVTQGFAKTDKANVEKSGQMCAETVDCIRTVAMLSLEPTLLQKFEHLANGICRRGVRHAHLNGISYGIAQAVIFFAYAATFTYGAYLVKQGEMEFFEVFRVFSAIIFGGQQVGRSLSSAPNFKTAVLAASRLFALIDRQPRIDMRPNEGKIPVSIFYSRANIEHLFNIIDLVYFTSYSGRLHIDNASFTYPSRPEATILRACTLRVESGQTLALLGPSGCGKSTVLQLLQRFYDPQEGSVVSSTLNINKGLNHYLTSDNDFKITSVKLVFFYQNHYITSHNDVKIASVKLVFFVLQCADSSDLQLLDVSWWRSQLAVVSQEPNLFHCTIAQNIAYGDNTRDVTMGEIITAARDANIHSFITTLPQGYETSVGDKGLQLSGGQKQRIAIARALVRKPKILLFDEATSALDTESEKVVQEAMDKARRGRTCIIVTHRLSTVRNAHKIAVMHEGAVQELGSHTELMNHRGAYYRRIHKQNNSSLTTNL